MIVPLRAVILVAVQHCDAIIAHHCFQVLVDELNGWGDNLVHKNLKAVMRDDRIAVLYSNKDYSSEWNYHPDNKRFSAVDNTRFGVNIIVYALTR